MKAFFSFILAAILYVAFGGITWIIVCKNIDSQSYTLYDLALLKMTIYTGATAILLCLGMLLEGSSGKDKWYCMLALLFAVFGNWTIGTLSEETDGFWSKIPHLIAAFYNIINVGLLYIVVRLNLDKK